RRHRRHDLRPIRRTAPAAQSPRGGLCRADFARHPRRPSRAGLSQQFTGLQALDRPPASDSACTRSASLGRRPFRACGWGEESIVLPSSRAERSAVEGPYFLRFAAIWLKQGPSTWPFGPWSGRRKASVSFLHHQLRHKKGVTAPHPFWLQGVTVLNAFKILL